MKFRLLGTTVDFCISMKFMAKHKMSFEFGYETTGTWVSWNSVSEIPLPYIQTTERGPLKGGGTFHPIASNLLG